MPIFVGVLLGKRGEDYRFYIKSKIKSEIFNEIFNDKKGLKTKILSQS